MAYEVMTHDKAKKADVSGLQAEANRTAKSYNNDVDLERSCDNIILKQNDNWHQEINKNLNRFHIKTKKDSVMLITSVYSASPEFFEKKSKEEIKAYFEDCLAFHEKYYGKCINAVVHMDEKTPHLQTASVPITSDRRLSAKDIIGNRTKMSKMQNQFHEEVGKKWGLDRGKPTQATKAKRKTELDHKLEQLEETLVKEKNELQDIRESITKGNDAIEQMENTYDRLHNDIEEGIVQYKTLDKKIKKYKEDVEKIEDLSNRKYNLEQDISRLNNRLLNTQNKLKSSDYERLNALEQFIDEKNLQTEFEQFYENIFDLQYDYDYE